MNKFRERIGGDIVEWMVSKVSRVKLRVDR
jgi:hypothetical protein